MTNGPSGTVTIARESADVHCFEPPQPARQRLSNVPRPDDSDLHDGEATRDCPIDKGRRAIPAAPFS